MRSRFRRSVVICAVLLAFAGAGVAQSVTVNITWSPGSGGPATGFVVQRSQSATSGFATIGSVVAPSSCIGLTGSGTCSCAYVDVSGTDSNVLTVGQVYYYQVAAVNGAVTGSYGNPSGVTILAPNPVPPPVPPTIGTIVNK